MSLEPPTDRDVLSWDRDDLDGHTIEGLIQYLDNHETPPDPSIDQSAACQIALDALRRLRGLSAGLLDWDAAQQPERDDGWVHAILASIGMEAQAGRDIPLSSPSPVARLVVTEGAIRGLARAAADEAGGILIGRCRFAGDVTIPGEPITLDIEATAYRDEPIHTATQRVRTAITREIARHTDLNLAAINFTIHDVLDRSSRTNEENGLA